MKKVICRLLTAALVTATLLGCSQKSTKESSMRGSSGKTLEILVAADKEIFRADTKELIDSIFCSPQEGLPQPEPMFDLVNVPVSSFRNTEMFAVHRLVLLCDVNPENPNKVYMHVDQYAAPQVIFDFAVKDRATLDSLLRCYATRMVDEYHKMENRRIIKVFHDMAGVEVNRKVKDKFGFALTFSNEFELARTETDFAWIRKETKDFGIGVLVSAYTYSDQKMFDQEQILDRMDTMMHHYVPASVEGSYIGSERRLPIVSKTVEMKGVDYCVETRGCYRAYGDFMGGPFVCYTLLAPEQKRVVQLTGYVYYPSGRIRGLSKRDLLMQVEGICHSIQFD